jgi:hypothetical protein
MTDLHFAIFIAEILKGLFGFVEQCPNHQHGCKIDGDRSTSARLMAGATCMAVAAAGA